MGQDTTTNQPPAKVTTSSSATTPDSQETSNQTESSNAEASNELGLPKGEAQTLANLRNRISKANDMANAALTSKDISALQAAKAEILGVGDDLEKFADAAKKHQVNIDRQIEDLGWPSLHAKLRNINMEIAKQALHGPLGAMPEPGTVTPA
jgi:hypothetical protein